MPNQPKTPGRSIRIPDALWKAAKREAAEHGETVTDVVIRALEEYANRRGETATDLVVRALEEYAG